MHLSIPTARRLGARLTALAALALTSLAAAPALALEPWSDPDPPNEGTRWTLGDFGFRAGAEYRAQFLYINPIGLNSEADRETSWIEHRLRLDAAVDYRDKVRVVLSSDVLDGVLWGDNGDFGGTPSSNSGINVSTKNPNVTRPCVGLTGPDALDANSYSYTVCPQEPIKIRKAYGEVSLPFGLLRIGRQPVNLGMGVQAADGDGRPNRFGISRTGSVVDRVLFATKPLEAFKPKEQRSTSANEGLILALAYDRWVTDNPENLGRSLHQWDTALRFLAPRYAFGSDLLLSVYHAHRWDSTYNTKVNSLGGRLTSRFLNDHLHVGIDLGANLGTTREVAEAYKVINNDPVIDQKIKQFGARRGAVGRALVLGLPRGRLRLRRRRSDGEHRPHGVHLLGGHQRWTPALQAHRRLPVGALGGLRRGDAAAPRRDHLPGRGHRHARRLHQRLCLLPSGRFFTRTGPCSSAAACSCPGRRPRSSIPWLRSSAATATGLKTISSTSSAASPRATTGQSSTGACSGVTSITSSSTWRRRSSSPARPSRTRTAPPCAAASSRRAPPSSSDREDTMIRRIATALLGTALLAAAPGCAVYEGPPQVKLDGITNGYLSDTKAPVVLEFSKPVDPATVRVKIIRRVIDTEGNLADEDDDPKTNLDILFSTDPTAEDVGGFALLSDDKTKLTIKPKAAFSAGASLAVLIEKGLSDTEGHATLVRKQIVFSYDFGVKCDSPTTLFRSGTYFFLAEVKEPIGTQVRLFTSMDVDPATGAFVGRFTSAVRNPDPSRCTPACSSTTVCRLYPAQECVPQSQRAGTTAEYPRLHPQPYSPHRVQLPDHGLRHRSARRHRGVHHRSGRRGGAVAPGDTPQYADHRLVHGQAGRRPRRHGLDQR